MVQAQSVLQSADERSPLIALGAGAERKRCRGDGGEPAGDLPAAHPGEQAGVLDVDAGVDERGGNPLRQVFSWSELSAPPRVARLRLWISSTSTSSVPSRQSTSQTAEVMST